MNIGIVLKNAAGAVIHAVESPFKAGQEIESLYETFEKDEPKLKAVLTPLVGLVEGVGGDATGDIAGDGLNIASDVKTFTDVAAVYTYVKTQVIPVIKEVFSDFKADVDAPAAAATPVAAVTEETTAKTGPGLHTVVPA